MRQILSEPDVPSDARQAGDDLRRLDSPDRIDCAVDVGHACRLPPTRGVVQRRLRWIDVESGFVVHQANLAGASADDFEEPLSPLDGLGLGCNVDDRVAANYFLALGERPVGDGELAVVGDMNAGAA